nr:retrovirus-related Pol polyprotein from transposon TNT 1-94 [Tanacetum cinerariifolium]
NRVLVVKPHFKTPYELFRGRTHALSFMRPFGCHVTILNTLDHLRKFDGKLDEWFFVGYSTTSKAFRVYNTRTRKVEENLHIKFLENKPIIAGNGPKWLFDIDTLTKSMNYVPVIAESEIDNQERPNAENNTKDVNTARPSINTASSNINTTSPIVNTVRQSDDLFGADNDMRSLNGVEVDISNISTTYLVPTNLKTRIHKDHTFDNVIEVKGLLVQKVFRNKKDKRGIVIRNKARLVAQRCTQEEGIDYDEIFAPVARIEAIRGKINQTLFIKRQKEDILLVQVYVDDIIFGFTKKELCTEFEKLMHDKFQMSSMGELIFFSRLQVKQKSNEIFISQNKYIDEILRKFKYTDVKPASTQMDKENALLKDSDGDDVDVHLYSTLDNREIQLNATVDGQARTITEASVRRHLKLADTDGISTLPTTKFFELLALMGIPQSNVPSSVADEAITNEMHDGLNRAVVTYLRPKPRQHHLDQVLQELAQKVVPGATLL